MIDDKDDKEFFLEQMTGVRRLSSDQAPPSRPKPRPHARFRRADEKQVLRDSLHGEPGIDAHEEVAFARPEITT